MLDMNRAGIVLVDETMALVQANRAALAMFERGGAIRLRAGRVLAEQALSQTALESAVRQAAVDEAGIGRRGLGVPVRDAEGAPFVIHVLPLRVGALRRGLVARACAALFVSPSAIGAPPPSEALSLLYDLTPAELRVLELIAAGRNGPEICHELGIAESTMRTHLRRVFEKTDTRRQADLVALLASYTLAI
jgi:DNA-binding CsgD family transcriptional regulator